MAAIIYLSFTSTSSIMQDIFPLDLTLENYLTIFEKPRVLKPLLNSLEMSLMAVAAGLVITVPTSWMIVKYGGKFHGLLKVLLMLPWTMPASVVAINLINAFSKESHFRLRRVADRRVLHCAGCLHSHGHPAASELQ